MTQPAAQRKDFTCEPMPPQRVRFILDRTFTEEELATLRLGLVPRDMDDRWFVFQENDQVYLHRSWTGHCIFILHLDATNRHHTVTANADPAQVRAMDPEELESLLTGVIDHVVLAR